MTTSQRRPSLLTYGTGHPRLYPAHDGHLYQGDATRPAIRLVRETTVIGSDPGADVVVAGLLPQHAEITRDAEDEYRIRALFGDVTVNGSAHTSTPLHSGDLIRCGPWSASFARDASTDHVRVRSQHHQTPPRGLFRRLERLVYMFYGSSEHAPLHRFPARAPRATATSRDDQSSP
jgi:hypothetical protein